jgi:hypothetical protein
VKTTAEKAEAMHSFSTKKVASAPNLICTKTAPITSSQENQDLESPLPEYTVQTAIFLKDEVAN